MARLQIHPGGLIMNIFGLLVWVVALGGCGAVSYQCQQNYHDTYQCSQAYQWEWWSLWLEFFLLLALFISSFLESYNRGRMVFLAYFTMATVLTMWSAHNFINTSFAGRVPFDIHNQTQTAVNAGAAGFVLVSIANFCILIVRRRPLVFNASRRPPAPAPPPAACAPSPSCIAPCLARPRALRPAPPRAACPLARRLSARR